ncbi:glucose-6-phosphate dehydrogenase [uncultured Jatrophihabitans sp.]|uniref:glucose-6-phosphate dehydrogenase n=1 Tax=uncultured Jatrophihabitans sp. TaxID=1610747 RepID=UPI0035CBFE97
MQTRADAVVLFGVTGDLVFKKLFPALYQMSRQGRLGVPVIGVARSAWDDEQLIERAHKSIEAAVGQPDDAAFRELAARLTMVTGDYADPVTYERLAEQLRESTRPVFYLAIPPSVFGDVVAGLVKVGLAEKGRVIVEKPFGRDRETAADLNQTLAGAFTQSDIFRIDHYLGKESVEGLLVFRFANAFLEPVWNRNYIASVQVTLAEEFGTEGRAGFYDGVGAVRDVLQNHLLQVAALLAMEPPIADDADAYRDEEVKVLRQVEPLDPATTVRGQYVGYLDEAGVAAGSTTETFVSTKLSIESWRWAGVPFYLRAGKCMPGTATEAVVELRRPPRLLFSEIDAPLPEANLVRFRLGHSDGVTMSVQAKSPGTETVSQPVDLGVDFATALGHRQEAYERLLDDAMDGRRHRFARADTIDQEWRIVSPILDVAERPVPYYKGTWGPAQADVLAGGWHDVSLRIKNQG